MTSNNSPPGGFEPAVPLPVIAPSDDEQRAVLAMNERYSPCMVAARVAAIEKESARIRASREQTI